MLVAEDVGVRVRCHSEVALPDEFADPRPWDAAQMLERDPPMPRSCGLNAGHWLPGGAWQACVGEPEFTPGEPIWVGVDVGGDKSASAVVWINADHHVGCEIYHGDEGVLDCVDKVGELAAEYQIRELIFDPWRFGQAAQELERERVIVTAFPQTDVRMVPASDRLYRP